MNRHEADLRRYHDLLLQWTVRVNLIGPEARMNLDAHIGEAVDAAALLEPRGLVLDFGSGGGLPAIPMAIVSPGVEFHMVESDRKKWAFLKFAIRTLRLSAVAHGDRLERVVERSVSALSFDLVTSRAVGHPERWLPLVAPRLAPAGRVALFEGSEPSEPLPGFEVEAVHRLSRGDSNFLVVLRKVAEHADG